jgi:hypothetical protein
MSFNRMDNGSDPNPENLPRFSGDVAQLQIQIPLRNGLIF